MTTKASLRILTIAFAALSSGSCSGDKALPTDPGDINPPNVTLSASESLLEADGVVTLVASASDDVGVASVDFREGSTSLGTVTSAPYELDLSLTSTDNGAHSYTAIARDAAGNQATSAAAAVNVSIPDLPFDEGFDDGQVGPLYWQLAEFASATAREVDGRLEVAIPAALSGADAWASIPS